MLGRYIDGQIDGTQIIGAQIHKGDPQTCTYIDERWIIPTEHSPNHLGLGPYAHELTMSISIVGMGNTAEPLLASCVPDLR